jgi:A/G-specific adenine glycosylase
VLLERRPDSGIWGGLWCLPEFGSETALTSYARDTLRLPQCEVRALGTLRHSFTHFDLDIVPMVIACGDDAADRVMEGGQLLWYNPGSAVTERARIGLPAPVKQLIEQLATGVR